MPIYDYRCIACKHEEEVIHPMNASAPNCSSCGNAMEKWFKSAPVVHGAQAVGRELAAQSLPQCGSGCRCCP